MRFTTRRSHLANLARAGLTLIAGSAILSSCAVAGEGAPPKVLQAAAARPAAVAQASSHASRVPASAPNAQGEAPVACYLPLISNREAPPTSGRIQPEDLAYLGAFRLPGPDDESGWAWGGSAMTYYPGGDPQGPDDGYPGSIFATGHDHTQYIGEISIPLPVISPGKNVDELNTAATLQPLRDIRGDLYERDYWELPRAGLAYLPRQGAQTSDKLYFCWGVHMQEGEDGPSHGWCELDLANPRSVGVWRIGGYWNYVTTDYLLDIPSAWADQHTPGRYLATGRFRDGGQGSMGPTLLAIGPWNQGNPPAPASTLPATPLLLYGSVYDEAPRTMDGYHHSDEWSGAAWLTVGGRSAVVFAGTKGEGECWYGFSDGTVWPDEPPYPPEPPDAQRGWWSSGFVGQLLFYDPADLAAVARGEMQPDEPQPYATMAVDDVLYHVQSEQEWYHLGAACFDRERGLFYLFEPRGDGDKPLVHVWRV